MSFSSKKHRDFASECISGKSVKKLPGIGETLGDNLHRSGYRTAADVYNQAHAMNFNKREFQGWMRDTCGANSKQSEDCYRGLKAYENQFGDSGSSRHGRGGVNVTVVNNVYIRR